MSLFREDVARYDSNSAGLPIIFSSIQGGDGSYTFTMKVTDVTNGGEDLFVSTDASESHYVSGTSSPTR